MKNMAEPSSTELLELFCAWLLKQSSANDTDTAADNKNGNIVKKMNPAWTDGQQKIWFIPGTWGAIKLSDRDIEVEEGSKLFVVISSSHATPDELPNGDPATEEKLAEHAKRIDKLWLHPALYITDPSPGEEKEVTDAEVVTTGKFNVNIDPNNGYAKLTQVFGNGIAMVATARVKLIPSPAAGTTTVLRIAGQSRKDVECGRKGEVEYNVHVVYNVKGKPAAGR